MSPLNRILVLASEPLAAALIGLLVETLGRYPVFAEAGELPSAAVARLRPIAVVLVDSSLDDARSDLFFATLERHGIRAVVFNTVEHARSIAEIASLRSIPWFTLPPTAGEVGKAIAAAAGDRRTMAGGRRLVAGTSMTADGTRILRDQSGNRWMVYDRRSSAGERRDTVIDDDVTRVFVSDAGERRECGLSATDVASASVSALEAQLSRAH